MEGAKIETAAEIESYLKKKFNGGCSLHDLLSKGLREMWDAHPAKEDAAEWLAKYLLEHNPTTPKIIPPESPKLENLPKTVQAFCVTGSPESDINMRAGILAEDSNSYLVSLENIIEELMKDDVDPFCAHIREYVSAGYALPDEDIISILKTHMLQKYEQDGVSKFVMEKFPQNMNQAILFEKKVCSVAKLIFLELSEEMVMQKLEQKGTDNGEIMQILGEAEENLTPLIPYYQSFKKLIKQSADQKHVQIWNQIKCEL